MTLSKTKTKQVSSNIFMYYFLSGTIVSVASSSSHKNCNNIQYKLNNNHKKRNSTLLHCRFKKPIPYYYCITAAATTLALFSTSTSSSFTAAAFLPKSSFLALSCFPTRLQQQQQQHNQQQRVSYFSTTTTNNHYKMSSTTTNDNDDDAITATAKIAAAGRAASLDPTKFQSYIPEELSIGARYGLCISSVIPRPVAVITSLSSIKTTDDDEPQPILNCAPFSYSSIATHDPPIVTHGLCLSRGNKKDTLKNIEATGEWVYNVLTNHYLESANACATTQNIDEASMYGLQTLPSDIIQTPRLQAAAISMECKLWDSKEVYNDAGEHTTTIVMGRVVKFHIHESVLLQDNAHAKDAPIVDLLKLNAVGRAGGVTYWPAGKVVEESVLPMTRPK